MPKVDMRQINPERYARVKAQQDRLKQECSGLVKLSRLCPYCEHRVENIVKGQHGYTFAKCPNCGEEIVFSPVMFRRNR